MAKYQPLTEYLKSLDSSEEQTMTFSEIERVLGFRLPPSARTHRAWWANQMKGQHTQAKAWHAAGWRTKDPDLRADKITFVPAAKRPRTVGELLRGLTISDAKKAVALQCGVRPEDVEITIRA